MGFWEIRIVVTINLGHCSCRVGLNWDSMSRLKDIVIGGRQGIGEREIKTNLYFLLRLKLI